MSAIACHRDLPPDHYEDWQQEAITGLPHEWWLSKTRAEYVQWKRATDTDRVLLGVTTSPLFTAMLLRQDHCPKCGNEYQILVTVHQAKKWGWVVDDDGTVWDAAQEQIAKRKCKVPFLPEVPR